jgi:hypothetical protein
MLLEGAKFVFLAILFLGSCAAAVYSLYCLVRAIGKNLRLLAHVRRSWMVPLYVLIPYSGFLTEEGRKHRVAGQSWMFRSALSVALSAIGFLFWALLQPRTPAWCADATPTHPKVGCPTADK